MSLWAYLSFLFISNALTFGNGPVLVPLLQGQLVDTQHLLTNEQLLYAFTIARVTPGQANLYVAAVGYMLFGFGGAVTSVLVILLPGYLMVALVHGYERLRHAAWVRRLTRGLTAASVGLIFAATLQIGRSSLNGPISLTVFALALVLLLLRPRWNVLLILLGTSLVGLALSLILG